MSVLVVRNLSLQAGAFRVHDVSFELKRGEYLVLMGRTGSGKSLIVKALCGLIRPDSGSIFIQGENVTRMEPRLRGIGYVPQESALFPHLSVERNLSFPDEVAGRGKAAAQQEAREMAETLGISYLLERRTHKLSGGECQKVALGRALARRPNLLVLDEPLSALDESTRRDVCAMLEQMRDEFKVAAIHVCHNLEEARILADRIGVVHEGRLLQVGTLEELQTNPACDAVAALLGG